MYFSYAPLKIAKNRDDVIIPMCAGKRVLHIGAADSPYTKVKLAQGLLLHKRLRGVASELVGIDLDQAAVDFLRGEGIDDIRIHDMNKISTLAFSPEVIIFGETIEHIENVRVALDLLKSVMTPKTKLIISTPNCFHLYFASMVVRNYEAVHDDHKLGFTYGLLWQMLKVNDLKMDDFYFTWLPRAHYAWWRRLWFLFAWCRKGFAETLLAVCTLEAKAIHE